MTPIVHGGQTGVDRGAHDAAIAVGWRITGYMPRDRRDERGQIPEVVARHLIPHATTSYAARTEANVHLSGALLIVVSDKSSARSTPGTAKTIDLAAKRRLPTLIVDPRTDAEMIARWIWRDLITTGRTLELPLETRAPIPPKLLVAGPRESKWPGACAETTKLLRRVADALVEIAGPPTRT